MGFDVVNSQMGDYIELSRSKLVQFLESKEDEIEKYLSAAFTVDFAMQDLERKGVTWHDPSFSKTRVRVKFSHKSITKTNDILNYVRLYLLLIP